jgi:hypothetical protein
VPEEEEEDGNDDEEEVDEPKMDNLNAPVLST